MAGGHGGRAVKDSQIEAAYEAEEALCCALLLSLIHI